MDRFSVRVKVRSADLTVFYKPESNEITGIWADECDDILALVQQPGAMSQIYLAVDQEIALTNQAELDSNVEQMLDNRDRQEAIKGAF